MTFMFTVLVLHFIPLTPIAFFWFWKLQNDAGCHHVIHNITIISQNVFVNRAHKLAVVQEPTSS